MTDNQKTITRPTPDDEEDNNPVQVFDLPAALQHQVEKETASPVTRRRRSILFEAYLIAAVSLFAILTLLARTTAYFTLDLSITRTVQAFDSPLVASLMRFISWFGFAPQAPLIIVLFASLLYMARLRWEALTALIAGTGVGALNFLVKIAIQRPRPTADLVNVFKDVSGYSFPSGHVMFYTAFFGFFLFLSFALLKRSWRRNLLLVCFCSLVALVGLSRVYLGEHWASDVLGAYLLGSLFLAAAIYLYRWGKSRFFTQVSPAA